MASRKNGVDAEVVAMSAAYAALKGLDGESFHRALKWVEDRYASDQRSQRETRSRNAIQTVSHQ